ncbi:MAG: SlyX [Verrucomicrobiota bacterium]|jgi:SlyX protein
MSEESSERFARIESHIAHLEHQVEELNGVVIEQGKVIERLRKQVQLQAQTIEDSLIEQVKANNPKPPHH